MFKPKKLLLPVVGLVLAGVLVSCGASGGLARAAHPISEKIDSENPTASHSDGISVILVGEGSTRVSLGSIPRELFLSGEKKGESRTAMEALPSYLAMKSPLYTLERRSEDVQTLVEILIPNDSQPYHTLDLYRWDTEEDKWVFVPGRVDAEAGKIYTDEFPDNVAVFQSSAVTPLISTVLEADQVLTGEVASSLNMVFPAGLQVQADGSLNGVLASGWQLSVGYAVVPLIRADGLAISSVINNEASLALHVQDLQTFVVSGDYNGVAIDYQGIALTDREAFTQFIVDLAAALDEYDKLLVVFLPQPAGEPPAWDPGGYDWQGIGAAADAVVVTTGNDPRNFAIDGNALSLLAWAVNKVSRLKIHVAFSSLSVIRTVDETYNLISYDEALAGLGAVSLETEKPKGGYKPGKELTFVLDGPAVKLKPQEDTGTYSYKLEDAEGTRRVWIVMANTVRARLDMASAYNIGGMVVNGLLAEGNDAGMLTAINEFKATSVSSVPSQMAIEWVVSDASGAVLDESTGLGTPFVWKAAKEGEYTVQGRVVGGRVSDRGSVSVKVKSGEDEEEDTPEPTQAPASTQAPAGDSPPPTDTPAPTESTPPPSTGGAGADGGGFELGGQVPGSLGHVNEMVHAGMSWVKFQVKWSPGLDPSVAGGFIAGGKAAGFKVLISTPGPFSPASIDYNSYVEFIRGMASYQPDAIEIWNEMNLYTEWPRGQYSPTDYVNNMLAPCFNAIKSVSPNTMVIIGALAPTGVDDMDIAMADYRYLQGLAAAGAANYANCVGAHHNAGATSPSATTGHPADGGGGHHSWYFQPTVDVYYYGLGGTLPVCLTEFGYVTGEGYGALPTNWSWGSAITVADQAAWLAEGVQIARGLGYVRLAIIWNVDFTSWGDDPQAGYAIVRPGGVCPACDALHNVMY
jgi:hypothetical protein